MVSRQRPAPDKPGSLPWPLTPVSWYAERRGFIAWMFSAGRRHHGKAITRERWKNWRIGIGKPFVKAAQREVRP